MDDGNRLDCKIFVEATQSPDELVALVLPAWSTRDISKGRGATRLLRSEQGDLEIRKNPEGDPSRASEFPDGFLHFRYALELYLRSTTSHDQRVLMAKALLNLLWSAGLPAVASCDYENELPHGGGFKDPSIPWPGPKHVSVPRATR